MKMIWIGIILATILIAPTLASAVTECQTSFAYGDVETCEIVTPTTVSASNQSQIYTDQNCTIDIFDSTSQITTNGLMQNSSLGTGRHNFTFNSTTADDCDFYSFFTECIFEAESGSWSGTFEMTGCPAGGSSGEGGNPGGSGGGTGGSGGSIPGSQIYSYTVSPGIIDIDSVPTTREISIVNTGIYNINFKLTASSKIDSITSISTPEIFVGAGKAEKISISFSPNGLNYEGSINIDPDYGKESDELDLSVVISKKEEEINFLTLTGNAITSPFGKIRGTLIPKFWIWVSIMLISWALYLKFGTRSKLKSLLMIILSIMMLIIVAFLVPSM